MCNIVIFYKYSKAAICIYPIILVVSNFIINNIRIRLSVIIAYTIYNVYLTIIEIVIHYIQIRGSFDPDTANVGYKIVVADRAIGVVVNI